MPPDELVLPAWETGTVADIVPSLLDPGSSTLLPDAVVDAASVVLLVIDGMGWHQLQARARLAPTLTALSGSAITTIAPSTTAAALTSITTGLGPGAHGVVGYRIAVEGEVLNMLSWRTGRGDAREHIVPEQFQPLAPFGGQQPVVVQSAVWTNSPFTRAHLSGTRQSNHYTMPTLAVEVRQAVAAGEPLVYAYYDGLDKVGHVHGFGEHYDSELTAIDQMVGNLLEMLPRGTALVVTADHGQVDCRAGETHLIPEVQRHIRTQSGEARFRWLHAEPGHQRSLVDALTDAHADEGWIRPVEQVLDEQWFGPTVSDQARSRLGDVALLARSDRWFVDPGEAGGHQLVGRHGSLTPAEMYVPLLTFDS